MRLRTAVHGTGPRRIALVHGLGGSGKTWQPLVGKILAVGGRSVTTVDLRGHGTSPAGAGYTLAEYAADLVETLPTGLDAVVGHSLGGAVVAAAAERLAPRRAVYLDPGFRLGLPTARWFWAVPAVTMGAVALASMPGRARIRSRFAPEDRALIEEARAGTARGVLIPTFRDVTRHPLTPGPPPVPSTVVLSAEGPSVVPDTLAAELAEAGWEIRHVPELHHEFWLEDVTATFAAVRDLL
ncbi:alpha/beta fold hydrolase [Pseudonocardia pini]|uniref:alpha/beta fold hydrolase n=1 Tax=Pseudonocardia pini TaxID=2758030 RepID=UPI0015F02DC7|nr:alpha/beta hydrolase [Pseudonocardia pini]